MKPYKVYNTWVDLEQIVQIGERYYNPVMDNNYTSIVYKFVSSPISVPVSSNIKVYNDLIEEWKKNNT